MSFKPIWSRFVNRNNTKTDYGRPKPIRKFNEEEYFREIKQKIDDLFDGEKDHDLDDVFLTLKERPKLDFDDETDLEMEDDEYENE